MTTLLLHPYMPETTGRLLEALGERTGSWSSSARAAAARAWAELAPLFPEVEARQTR